MIFSRVLFSLSVVVAFSLWSVRNWIKWPINSGNNKIRSADYNNYVMPLWICEWIKWARLCHHIFESAFYFGRSVEVLCIVQLKLSHSCYTFKKLIEWVLLSRSVSIGVDIYSWLFIIFDIFMAAWNVLLLLLDTSVLCCCCARSCTEPK